MSIPGTILKLLIKNGTRQMAKGALKSGARATVKEGVGEGLGKTLKWATGGVITGASIFTAGEMGYQSVKENKEKEENSDVFAQKERIWQEQKINLFDRTFQRLFGKNIVEKSAKNLKDDDIYNVNVLKEEGKKYFENIIGDTTGLTDKQIEKRYKKALREYYMQLTQLGTDDKIAEEILAGVISELKHDNRLQAVKDFINLGTKPEIVNRRALYAQNNAEVNLTKRDKFGMAPSQDDAIMYEYETFSNMDASGISVSLQNIHDRAEHIQKLKLKELNGTLTEAEKKELESLDYELFKDNYLVAGYTGGYTGVYSNGFIDDIQVEKYLSEIYKATQDFGITNDVFDKVNEFISKNELPSRNALNDFQGMMDKATGGKYTEYTMVATKGSGIKSAPDSELSHSYSKYESKAEDESKYRNIPTETYYGSESEITNPIKRDRGYSESISYIEPKTKQGKMDFQSELHKSGNVSEQTEPLHMNSNKDDKNPITTLAQAAVNKEAYDKYVYDNNITAVDSCIFLLSVTDGNLPDVMKAKAVDDFKNKLNKTEKMLVYSSLGKIAKQRLMPYLDKEFIEEQIPKEKDIDTRHAMERDIKTRLT